MSRESAIYATISPNPLEPIRPSPFPDQASGRSLSSLRAKPIREELERLDDILHDSRNIVESPARQLDSGSPLIRAEQVAALRLGNPLVIGQWGGAGWGKCVKCGKCGRW